MSYYKIFLRIFFINFFCPVSDFYPDVLWLQHLRIASER